MLENKRTQTKHGVAEKLVRCHKIPWIHLDKVELQRSGLFHPSNQADGKVARNQRCERRRVKNEGWRTREENDKTVYWFISRLRWRPPALWCLTGGGREEEECGELARRSGAGVHFRDRRNLIEGLCYILPAVVRGTFHQPEACKEWRGVRKRRQRGVNVKCSVRGRLSEQQLYLLSNR